MHGLDLASWSWDFGSVQKERTLAFVALHQVDGTDMGMIYISDY